MIGVFFCYIALLVASFVEASKYYGELIKENVTDVSILQLSVTYYSEGQIVAETDNTNYFVLQQCDISTAGKKYAQLNIISPENPTFNTSQSYVVVELSSCEGNWNSTCLIATNYIWDTRNPTIFTNISWIYLTQSNFIYGRFRSYIRDSSITLLLSYTDYGAVNIGKYEPGVIPGTIVYNANYHQLSQFVKSSHLSYVQTNAYQVFFFSFCSQSWPGTNDYSITATVTGDPSLPLSAFDLIGCAYSEFPDPADCTPSNLHATKDQDAAPLVDIIMFNDEKTDLTAGLYLVVYGEGGEPDGRNAFLIDVTIEMKD